MSLFHPLPMSDFKSGRGSECTTEDVESIGLGGPKAGPRPHALVTRSGRYATIARTCIFSLKGILIKNETSVIFPTWVIPRTNQNQLRNELVLCLENNLVFILFTLHQLPLFNHNR